MQREPILTTVFSDGENGGNPAPVFLAADALTDEEMRQAAAAFGMEAVFVTAAKTPGCGAALRYFTPDHELTSCGHATVAAVTVLVEEGLLTGSSALLETAGGPVPVSWERTTDGILVMTGQSPPEFRADAPDKEALAAALGIPVSALAGGAECVSTSRWKLLVPVCDRAALDAIDLDDEALFAACDACGCSGFYVFCRDESEANAFFARQFPLRSGYREDPATGVAAAALGAWAAARGQLETQGDHARVTVRQGYAMGRPSLLIVDLDLAGGAVAGVRVCGYAKRIDFVTALG